MITQTKTLPVAIPSASFDYDGKTFTYKMVAAFRWDWDNSQGVHYYFEFDEGDFYIIAKDNTGTLRTSQTGTYTKNSTQKTLTIPLERFELTADGKLKIRIMGVSGISEDHIFTKQ